MKADLSRDTFEPRKHYSGVVMQQGRVAVDADWNEQAEIQRHRVDTETIDVIGDCGIPTESPGFGIAVDASGDSFTIGAGRAYIDGLLCENDAAVEYTAQGELRDPAPVVGTLSGAGAAFGLVYLEAWERHVTRIDDPDIRESALGEADTATRTKTSWQVKVLPLAKAEVGGGKTAGDLAQALADERALEQNLAAAKPADRAAIRAQLSAKRAEVETMLDGLGCSSQVAEWGQLVKPGAGMLTAKTTHVGAATDPCLPPPSAGYTRLENQLYRVEVHEGGDPGTASFKWSRENGSVVTAIEGVSGAALTVASLGYDATLGFAPGQWVEVIDDHAALHRDPAKRHGTIVQIDSIHEARRIVTLASPVAVDLNANPQLRRWDQSGNALRADGLLTTGSSVDLEGGIQVVFGGSDLRTGDYWLIPARTTKADIEWPVENGAWAAQPPEEPSRHHYCRLALVLVAGGKLTLVSDCRELFSPLTKLTNFLYLGGDGQEVKPTIPWTGALVPLDEPLEVGVARGEEPVAGATVRFEVVAGSGRLEGTATQVDVETGADGIARCDWSLASNKNELAQQVRATLLDAPGTTRCLPIDFSARLSVASEVAYDPGACTTLASDTDVQAAIDRIAGLTELVYVTGDGQEPMPSEVGKLEELVVRVVSDCGPVEGATVAFTADQGNGKLADDTVVTGADGYAKTQWTPDPATEVQHAFATLKHLGNGGTIDLGRDQVEFHARLSRAREVEYTPDGCETVWKGVRTVQAALDRLARVARLQYVSGDGQEGLPGKPLPFPLQVGVFSDCGPVAKVPVRFRVVLGKGRLGGPHGELVVETDKRGIAECPWTLDAGTPRQRVEAALAAERIHRPGAWPTGVLVAFDATLSDAARVRYTPPANCEGLGSLGTVQEALDRLALEPQLLYAGGDGQTGTPGDKLPEPLQVGVFNACGPVAATVRFLVPRLTGIRGRVARPVPVDVATVDGVASLDWTLAAVPLPQTVTATLLENGAPSPRKELIRFTAYRAAADAHPSAGDVEYKPPCPALTDVTDVQAALDRLAQDTHLVYRGGDAQEGAPGTRLRESLQVELRSECGLQDGTVQFRSAVGNGSPAGVDGRVTLVETQDGVATCDWIVGDEPELQLVEAVQFEGGGGGRPVGDVVRFLVRRGSPEPIRIDAVAIGGKPFQNDMTARASALNAGLEFHWVLPEDGDRLWPELARPVLSLWLAMPFTGAVGGTGTPMLVGYTPLELDGRIAVDEEKRTITWAPADATAKWLPGELKQLITRVPEKRILCRIHLAGNFVVAERGDKKDLLYLDGDAFFAPAAAPQIRLPTGDGVTGGSFEGWFWLTP